MTAVSSSAAVHKKLLTAANEEPGAPALLNSFTCYPKTALTLYNRGISQKRDFLTPAERAAFNLYLEGMTAMETAAPLSLSINTIKTHNKRIYAKLNVSSRKELLLYVSMMEKLRGKAEVPLP